MERLQLSPKFSETLQTVLGDHFITSLLYTGLSSPSIQYLNFEVKEGKVYLNYLPRTRFDDVRASGEDHWTSKRRQSGKLGKSLQKLFPNVSGDILKDFVEKFTAIFSEEGLTFDLVERNDIKKWYHEHNYHPLASTSTVLGNSCMRYDKCQNWFDIYTKNPGIVKMAIALRDNKLVARALIWQALDDNRPTTILDRIYYCTPQDYILFEKRWKPETEFGKIQDSTIGSRKIYSHADPTQKGQILEVPLENWRYKYMPYMDTFNHLDKTTGRLTSKQLSSGSFRSFTKTEGGYTDSDGDYAVVVPEGHIWLVDQRIWEDPANLVQIDGIYLPKSAVKECAICNVFKRKNTLVKVKEFWVCGLDIVDSKVTINDTIYSQCLACQNWKQDSNEFCENCARRYVRCRVCADVGHMATNDRTVCHRCEANMYKTCSDCHSSVNILENLFKLGKCEACFTKNKYTCASCSKKTKEPEQVDGTIMCLPCIEKRGYTYCTSCNEYHNE